MERILCMHDGQTEPPMCPQCQGRLDVRRVMQREEPLQAFRLMGALCHCPRCDGLYRWWPGDAVLEMIEPPLRIPNPDPVSTIEGTVTTMIADSREEMCLLMLREWLCRDLAQGKTRIESLANFLPLIQQMPQDCRAVVLQRLRDYAMD